MSRIIRVIIQKSSYRNITEERLKIVNLFSVMFRYEDFLIITQIILLIVYILRKSKHLIWKTHECDAVISNVSQNCASRQWGEVISPYLVK